jgi:hypothetical protein
VLRPKTDWKTLGEESSLRLAKVLAEKWAPELERVATPEYRAKVTQWGRKQHEARTGAKVLGEWTPEMLSPEWGEIEFDSTEAMDGEGVYEVKLEYQSGSSMLRIEWVALMQDGREVARETHPGRTGKSYERNVYRLKLGLDVFDGC